MAKKKGGRKGPYYERQKSVTIRNRTQRARRRAKRLADWVAKGVKKNGEKVLSMEERKVRAENRKKARLELRSKQKPQWIPRKFNNRSNRFQRKPALIKEDES